MSTLPDRDLVLRVRHGEVDAYGELVGRFQSSVFNVCYRLLGERREAEDLAQEAFIRAYERLGSFDMERPFGPWIRRVAANLCLNRLQKYSPIRVPLDEEFEFPFESHSPNPETVYEQTEQAEMVRNALITLSPRYRIVIELRHFQEMAYEEIAQTLNLPVNTVKSHLFRARKLLADKLNVQNNPEIL